MKSPGEPAFSPSSTYVHSAAAWPSADRTNSAGSPKRFACRRTEAFFRHRSETENDRLGSAFGCRRHETRHDSPSPSPGSSSRKQNRNGDAPRRSSLRLHSASPRAKAAISPALSQRTVGSGEVSAPSQASWRLAKGSSLAKRPPSTLAGNPPFADSRTAASTLRARYAPATFRAGSSGAASSGRPRQRHAPGIEAASSSARAPSRSSGAGNQRASHPSAAGTRPGRKRPDTARSRARRTPRAHHCADAPNITPLPGTGPFPIIPARTSIRSNVRGAAKTGNEAIRTALPPGGTSPISGDDGSARPLFAGSHARNSSLFETRTSNPAASTAFGRSPPSHHSSGAPSRTETCSAIIGRRSPSPHIKNSVRHFRAQFISRARPRAHADAKTFPYGKNVLLFDTMRLHHAT